MLCICGHPEEEHAQGFLRKCESDETGFGTEDDRCPCLDFEENED